MNIKEQIAHLKELDEAIDAGKTIQWRQGGGERFKWEVQIGSVYNLQKYQFRVKPEPRKVYINTNLNGSMFVHETKLVARNHASTSARSVAVEYVEVEGV